MLGTAPMINRGRAGRKGNEVFTGAKLAYPLPDRNPAVRIRTTLPRRTRTQDGKRRVRR